MSLSTKLVLVRDINNPRKSKYIIVSYEPEKYKSKIDLSIEWINSLDKIINDNGCWVSTRRAEQDGYVSICIDRNRYYLHRLVLCIIKNLDYYDKLWDTRHGYKCSRACFNPEHIQSGSSSENARDSVIHKTNKETRKKVCPTCGSEYKIHKIKSGFNRGKIGRVCKVCHAGHEAIRKRRR